MDGKLPLVAGALALAPLANTPAAASRPPVRTRSVRTAPETGPVVAKAFLGPSAGIRFRHAGGGPRAGFEVSFGMLADRESHWIQIVSLIELR
jgi:hypothetical protein